jgi:hypothetical protein
MLKRILSLLLIGSITIHSQCKPKRSGIHDKVKAAIAKLGTGPSAQVKITLRDNNKLKGYIKEAHEDHFVLVHELSTRSQMQLQRR